jgi:hypothetical protein
MTGTEDGIDVEVEETDKGFRWVYQSPGGACFVSPRADYGSRASARRAGRIWLAKWRETYP